MDQQLADLNVDSTEQGFGGELDTAEILPNNVQKSHDLDKKEQRQQEREAAKDVRNYGGSSNGTGGTSGTYGTGSTGGTSTGDGYGSTGMTEPAAALKCWHCEADSYELCGQTGYEEPCHANQVLWLSCATQVTRQFLRRFAN